MRQPSSRVWFCLVYIDQSLLEVSPKRTTASNSNIICDEVIAPFLEERKGPLDGGVGFAGKSFFHYSAGWEIELDIDAMGYD